MRIKSVAMAFNKRKETCSYKLIVINPITSICVYLTKTTKGMMERINSLVNGGKTCSTATITVTTKDVAGDISATGIATASSAIWTDSTAWTSTAFGIGKSYKCCRNSPENQCLQSNHCFSCSLLLSLSGCVYEAWNMVNQVLFIIQSVDSICRDGADTPIRP